MGYVLRSQPYISSSHVSFEDENCKRISVRKSDLKKILLGKRYKDNIETKGYGMDSTGSIGTNDRLLETQKQTFAVGNFFGKGGGWISSPTG